MGRVGVDVYPQQIGVALEDVTSFGKYLGGSATNVAVAAARHGRRTAVITRTGADPFGRYIHQALRGLRRRRPLRRRAVPDLPTPVDVLRDLPAGRLPAVLLPPAQGARPGDPRRRARPRRDPGRRRLLGDRHRAVRGAAPRRHVAALEARGGHGITVLDLDYRPMFWPSARRSARGTSRGAVDWSTSRSATSTSARSPSASGSRRPRPRRCSTRGRAGGGQAGPGGVLGVARRRRRSSYRRCRSRSSTGSAPATRSAARCATACWPAGTSSGSCGSPTRPAPSWPAAGLRRRDADHRRARGSCWSGSRR